MTLEDDYECDGQLSLYDWMPDASKCISEKCYHEDQGKCYCIRSEHYYKTVPPSGCNYMDACTGGGIEVNV